jgi:hypothetical protein
VTVHFTMLGVFHNTQTLPLGQQALRITQPTPAACG